MNLYEIGGHLKQFLNFLRVKKTEIPFLSTNGLTFSEVVGESPNYIMYTREEKKRFRILRESRKKILEFPPSPPPPKNGICLELVDLRFLRFIRAEDHLIWSTESEAVKVLIRNVGYKRLKLEKK